MGRFMDKILGTHKRSKEDIKMTSMLFMCILTVMVSAVSIISIYEEKSLLDLIVDVANEAESMMTDGKSEMVCIGEGAVPLAASASSQPKLRAKKNRYNFSELYEKDGYRYYYEKFMTQSIKELFGSMCIKNCIPEVIEIIDLTRYSGLDFS